MKSPFAIEVATKSDLPPSRFSVGVVLRRKIQFVINIGRQLIVGEK